METQGNAAAQAEWHLVQSCQRHLFLAKALQIFGILLSFYSQDKNCYARLPKQVAVKSL